MATHRRNGSAPNRLSVAELAARLMADGGIDSFHAAKRKAAERLGMKGRRNLPDNTEIAELLQQYQRLFRAAVQAEHLHQKRRIALAAMRLLTEFSPRLVGPVLVGTAGEHSAVSLHVFTDTPEEVGLRLFEEAIPYQPGERRVRVTARTVLPYPCYQFMAGEIAVELVIFSRKDTHQAPLSPLDGKPMHRADRAAVEALMAGSTAEPPVSRCRP